MARKRHGEVSSRVEGRPEDPSSSRTPLTALALQYNSELTAEVIENIHWRFYFPPEFSMVQGSAQQKVYKLADPKWGFTRRSWSLDSNFLSILFWWPFLGLWGVALCQVCPNSIGSIMLFIALCASRLRRCRALFPKIYCSGDAARVNDTYTRGTYPMYMR